MHIRGFIELSPEIDRELLARLIRAAHRAAQDGRVVLALNGISIHAVTRHLDPAGQLSGHDQGGLRYRPVDIADETLLDQARSADFVIADSEPLSAALLSRGVLHMRAREGVRYLDSIAPQGDHEPSGSPGFLASW